MCNRRCNDCRTCRIQAQREPSFDSWSVSSTATEDNRPGPGRGLDQIYQYLGRHLDRGMGVVMDKLGHGPAAAERRALKAIELLSPDGFYRIKVVRGKRRVKVLTPSEIEQAERQIRKVCERLAEYSRCVACARRSACSHDLILCSADLQRQQLNSKH
jgi:hypothetical protein